MKRSVPLGVALYGKGPTVDFALGRIFEAAMGDAHDSIVKRDAFGVPLSADKWETDARIKKTRAEAEYVNRNCELLK